MQIPTGQAAPTAAFFQALQGTPRSDGNEAARDSAKPVAKADQPRAVEAAGRSERNEPPKEGARDLPRGSFVDIST